MKLPTPNPPLDLSVQLGEFDIWITATLGEIRDTARFQQELDAVVTVFDALANATNGFAGVGDCSPDAISGAMLTLIDGKIISEAVTVLMGAASLLFLTTGKSDNNAKCQLPLHLRHSAKWTGFPQIKKSKKGTTLGKVSIPRVLPADRYMPLVALMAGYADEQKRLLLEFVRFVLSDDKYVAQLWSIGHSYVQMKQFGRERELLTPLIIFQVRGSVSASGGHEPEKRLRKVFDYLGLVPDVDFNTSDVVISGDQLLPVVDANETVEGTEVEVEVEAKGAGTRKKKIKTRAYDFVLPFRTPGWKHRVFIQSQYYAGDSGSVSHKNVDQTRTSRLKVHEHYEFPIFVEYVDGAGYFSSLNGDLKSLLDLEDTHTFIQVRTAPIRVRRVLQEIGFCTPLEIEHAIVRSDSTRLAVSDLLLGEGYSKEEIDRCLAVAFQIGFIGEDYDILEVKPHRRPIVRRFLLLDIIACNGSSLMGVADSGFLLVPGYGPFFGMKLTDVLMKAVTVAPRFADEFNNSKVLLGDLQWLEEQRYVVAF
jgi:hypothetical protein